MQIRLTTGMYEGGVWYDPGEVLERDNQTALRLIEAGAAEACPEAEAAAEAPARAAALNHSPKLRQRK